MTAIGSLLPGGCRLTTWPALSKRPIITLVEALRQWGVNISCEGETAPVTINGGKLKGGLAELPGHVEPEYVSALLLIAPLAEEKAVIHLTTPLESKPYVLMTLECLREFGINIDSEPDLMQFEASRQSYRPACYKVEGDWSSASYLLGLGAVAGEIKVDNLSLQSLQGDKAIINLLKEMNAVLDVAADSVKVKKAKLTATKANLNDCIDLLPTAAALATMIQGTSEFYGIQRARLKDSPIGSPQ